MGYLIAALAIIQSVSSTNEVVADYKDFNPALLQGLYTYDDYSPQFLWKRMASDVTDDVDSVAASPEVVEKRGDMWKFRGGKRGDPMWKFRGGKRDKLWKLRTGKRSDDVTDIFKRDAMWKLRGGKRSGQSYKRHWKLRQGK